MDGGNKVIGLWQGREPQGAGQTPPQSPYFDQPVFDEEERDAAIRAGRRRQTLIVSLCSLAALAWLGLVGYLQWSALNGRSPTLSEIANGISLAAAPLALIAVIWMLAMRSSKAEISRFSRTTRAMHVESERLEALLAFVSARIDASRRELSDQGNTLLNLGDDTATRISGTTEALRREIDTISGHAQNLKAVAAAARGDVAVLLSHLPKAQILMRQIATSLIDAGNTAQEKAADLTGKVEQLGLHSAEARTLADQSSQVLAERLAGLRADSEQLAALVEASHARLADAGADSTDALQQRVGDIGDQVERIAISLSAQDEASKALVTRLEDDLGDLDEKFGLLDSQGRERAERIGESLENLKSQTSGLREALASGGKEVEDIAIKTDALLVSLETAATQVGQSLPASYAELETHSDKARAAISQLAPAIAAVASTSAGTLERLGGLDTLIAQHRTALAELDAESGANLIARTGEAEALSRAAALAKADLQALSESCPADLVDSLELVKASARAAADHARAAMQQIIPDAAMSLGDASKKALAEALMAQVEAQMAEISVTTERAVASAQKATDRLMRQMLTISETSAALEARITEANERAESNDQANFARRVALLIESLNSRAIDVTKILSNDVTDTAWAAYMRGDRGIFARRAVKLIESGEARDIAKHYGEDPEFCDQVNRYIHDYEAMLRNVMSTRDGTPLSVALLSSDTGKLYVALAQAIERLRS